MESQHGLLAFHTLDTQFLTVFSPSSVIFPLPPYPTNPLFSVPYHPRYCILALVSPFPVLFIRPFNLSSCSACHLANNTQ